MNHLSPAVESVKAQGHVADQELDHLDYWASSLRQTLRDLMATLRKRFELSGSGTAVVTTPGRFPGPRLSVPVDLGAGEANVKLACKRTCRVK